MRQPLSLLIGGGLLAWAAQALASPVSVSFVQPDRFTDASFVHLPSDRDRAEVQHDIERHLQQLAQRGLRPGETLKIEVLDIDLAGSFEPNRLRPGADVRIVRDIHWPRMTLRYTLARAGQVVANAEERVAHMGFLGGINRYPGSDRLRYEKAMLDDWFNKTIARRGAD